MSRKQTTVYYPALDSLRVFAILGVVLYHYIGHRLPGGFVGVDLFFVLAGYLALESVWRKGGGLSFVLRRGVRLWVPLIAVMVASIAFFTLAAPNFLFNIRSTLLSSLLFYNNWAQIQAGASYFEAFVNPMAFTHLWYVAMIFQLYVVLAFLAWIFSFRLHSKKQWGVLFFAIAVLSAVFAAVYFTPGADPSRVYYGTDTRAFAFFIGAGIACYAPSWRRKLATLQARPILVQGVSLVLFALVLASAFLFKDKGVFTYRGGLFLFALLCGGLIFLLTERGNVLSHLLSWRPLAAFGKMTYSMYLWYYPVHAYFTYGPLAQSYIGVHFWLQWLLLFVLSLLTYVLFEKIATTKVLHARWRIPEVGLRAALESRVAYLLSHRKALIARLLVLAICVVAFVGTATAPAGENETVAALQARIAENEKRIAEEQKAAREKALSDVQDIEGLPREARLFAYELPVTFVGDSILLAASSSVAEIFPHAVINGAVGRQLVDATSIVQEMESKGEVQDKVVLVLGTNGAFTKEQAEKLLDALGQREILLVNTRVPRSWEQSVNETLKTLADERENVHLIDWYSVAQGHTDWLEPDAVHTNKTGSQALAVLIANDIYDLYGKKEKASQEAAIKKAARDEALESTPGMTDTLKKRLDENA